MFPCNSSCNHAGGSKVLRMRFRTWLFRPHLQKRPRSSLCVHHGNGCQLCVASDFICYFGFWSTVRASTFGPYHHPSLFIKSSSSSNPHNLPFGWSGNSLLIGSIYRQVGVSRASAGDIYCRAVIARAKLYRSQSVLNHEDESNIGAHVAGETDIATMLQEELSRSLSAMSGISVGCAPTSPRSGRRRRTHARAAAAQAGLHRRLLDARLHPRPLRLRARLRRLPLPRASPRFPPPQPPVPSAHERPQGVAARRPAARRRGRDAPPHTHTLHQSERLTDRHGPARSGGTGPGRAAFPVEHRRPGRGAGGRRCAGHGSDGL